MWCGRDGGMDGWMSRRREGQGDKGTQGHRDKHHIASFTPFCGDQYSYVAGDYHGYRWRTLPSAAKDREIFSTASRGIHSAGHGVSIDVVSCDNIFVRPCTMG